MTDGARIYRKTREALVFRLGSRRAGEDVEEDTNDVADEQSGSAERDERLNCGEPEPVTEGKRRGEAQRAEDKRHQQTFSHESPPYICTVLKSSTAEAVQTIRFLLQKEIVQP